MRALISFALLFCAAAAHAQIKAYAGVKGGAQFSSAYFSHTLQSKFITTTFVPGASGGVLFKFFTNQTPGRLNAGLQGGMGITQRGWKQTFRTTEPSFTTRMTNLEMPVEALVYFGHLKTKFFFTLGLYTDYMLNVEAGRAPNLENLGGADFYPYDAERDRRFGYGIRASIGVMRDFSFGLIHLDAFVSYGARSFIEHGQLSSGIPDLSNHYAGGFTVAYLIPFGKMDF